MQEIAAALAQYQQSRSQSRHDDLSDLGGPLQHKIASIMGNTLLRLAPPGSYYANHAKRMQDTFGHQPSYLIPQFAGLLESLSAEYGAGSLHSIAELVHADLFSDFIEMARHLNSEGYKDAAAVVAGSTLESHLRQLCAKFEIPTTSTDGHPIKADRLNADLGKKAYNIIDQKQVTAWLNLRNDAAHGNYTNYTKEQVVLLIDGVANFMARNSA